MKRFWTVLGTRLARVALTAILAAPIVIYINKFGFKISNDHTRWAEMGSAMSGIYGPILAWLAFGVLILQVRMQSESNKHMLDQAYVQNAREDVDFYLTRLEAVLDKPSIEGQTPRSVLHTAFAFATTEQLSSEHLRQLSRLITLNQPHLQSMWSAIYSIFEGLRTSQEQPYALQFASTKQKASAMLSYPTCAALDNFVYCASEGRLNYHYNFSDILTEP